jgi:hypothetical protein
MNSQARRAIVAECIELSYAFAYYLDHNKYDELVNLFVPDGVFVRTGVRLAGRGQILATMKKRPSEQFTRHVTTNSHFTQVEETTARAVFYNISYFAFTPNMPPLSFEPARVMLLDFIDIYTKTNDGWRFLERDARPTMIPEELRERLPPEAFLTRAQ